MTNKGTDKLCVADSLKHCTTCHYQAFLQNYKILGQVVPEKSLTEKTFTHTLTQTHKHCYRKGKTIYPLYTSYTGGIISLRAPSRENPPKETRSLALSVLRAAIPTLNMCICDADMCSCCSHRYQAGHHTTRIIL